MTVCDVPSYGRPGRQHLRPLCTAAGGLKNFLRHLRSSTRTRSSVRVITGTRIPPPSPPRPRLMTISGCKITAAHSNEVLVLSKLGLRVQPENLPAAFRGPSVCNCFNISCAMFNKEGRSLNIINPENRAFLLLEAGTVPGRMPSGRGVRALLDHGRAFILIRMYALVGMTAPKTAPPWSPATAPVPPPTARGTWQRR